MASKYVPPHMRNNAVRTETMNVAPPIQHRRDNRQNYKSQWQIEQDVKAENNKKKKLEDEKGREFNDNNFPSLVSAPTNKTVWGGQKSFAVLASEWKQTEEVKKESSETEKNEQRSYIYRQNLPLPKFHNVRRFVEPEDEEDTPVETTVNDDSDWKLVDRKKIRREKTIEEKLAETEDINDDSVWNADAPEEHETCWEDTH
jgi:hypothetical protein